MTLSESMDSFTQKFSPIFFLSDEGEPMFSITTKEKGRSTFKTSSDETRLLILKFFRDTGFKRNKEIILQMHEEIQALASLSNLRLKVSIRIFKDDGIVFIDLANLKGEIVKITNNKIDILKNETINFLRPTSLHEIPYPEYSEDWLERLEKYTNFQAEQDLILFLTFLVKSHFEGAHPILVLEGPQGSAKSSTTKLARNIIDPAAPSIVAPPRSSDDILIESKKGYVLAFDNLSGINADLSDCFCRTSTGGGITKRTLYKDESFKSHTLCRPIIINGIEEPTDRADFSERAIILNLKKISAENRISELEWEKGLKTDLPKILGGFYQLISDVLKCLPDIQTTNLPRMTEFARIGIAVENALSFNPGYFLSIYKNNLELKNENTFFNDPLCLALENILKGKKEILFNGTEELRREVLNHISQDYRYSNYCPKSPSAFSGRLSRLGPVLYSQGIEVERLPRKHDHKPIILRSLRQSNTDHINHIISTELDFKDIPF